MRTPPWGEQPRELEFSGSNWIWDDRTLDNEAQYFRRVIELPCPDLTPGSARRDGIRPG